MKEKEVFQFECPLCNCAFNTDEYKDSWYRDGKKIVTCLSCKVEQRLRFIRIFFPRNEKKNLQSM